MLGKKTPKTNSSFGSFSLRMYFSFDLRRPSQPLPMAGFCDLHAKKKIRFDALSIQRTPTIAADATNADADAKAELNTFSFIVHFWILLPKYCKVACLLLPHFLIYVSWKSHMTTFLALSLTHTHSPMTHLVLIWDGNCEKTRERESKRIFGTRMTCRHCFTNKVNFSIENLAFKAKPNEMAYRNRRNMANEQPKNAHIHSRKLF